MPRPSRGDACVCVQYNHSRESPDGAAAGQMDVAANAGGAAAARVPCMPVPCFPSRVPRTRAPQPPLQDVESLWPREDDPDLAMPIDLGSVNNTFVARYDFKGLEFAHPTRMVRLLASSPRLLRCGNAGGRALREADGSQCTPCGWQAAAANCTVAQHAWSYSGLTVSLLSWIERLTAPATAGHSSASHASCNPFLARLKVHACMTMTPDHLERACLRLLEAANMHTEGPGQQTKKTCRELHACMHAVSLSVSMHSELFTVVYCKVKDLLGLYVPMWVIELPASCWQHHKPTASHRSGSL